MSFWRRLFRAGFDVCGISDAGLVRQENQDSFFWDRRRGIFCVADGMGGGQGGAAASSILTAEIAKSASGPALKRSIAAVDRAVDSAGRSIREYAARHGFAAMATTLAVLAVDSRAGRAAIGNVGDSRVYRRRNRQLVQLSVDHRANQLSNFLTRAVGADSGVDVEWRETDVAPGDVYLVCSDGVSDMLPDSTINAILARGGDAQMIAEGISGAVRRAGARDNYTLLVVRNPA